MRHDPASAAIIVMLRGLKMYGMSQAVVDLMEQGAPAFEVAVPLLSQLLKAEMAEREVRSVAYQIKAARFPAYKDLTGFDFAASEVNEAMVRTLHGGDFIDGAHNVVLIGGPGTGKTHIATALGVQAVEHHRKKVRSGPDPEQFILDASGNPLYVANEDDSQVTIIDIEKNKVLAEVPVGVEPEGMGLSPDGKILVNTSETTNMAHFIDTKTFQVIDNVLVDARPRFAEFTADGKFLWVSAEVGGTVSVIDVAQRRVVKKITFKIPSVNDEAIQPVGIRITKDGTKAFVALGPANRVAVIDAKSYAVEKYLPVGQRVWQLAFTPDQKMLLTTNGTSNDISVIDVAAEKVVKSIPVGLLPWGVAVAPN